MTKKIRIGIDASRSRDSLQKTGVEVISDQLLRALDTALQGQDVGVVYYTPEKIAWLPQQSQKIIRLPRLWTVLRLSWELLINRPDVFVSPVHELPFFCPTKTYRVIHDVAFLRTPEAYSRFHNWYLRFGLRRSLRICEKVFVATNHVRDDLIALSQAAAEKIIVTGFGYEKKNTPELRQALSLQNNMRNKQFVYIGRVETKKNIRTLLQAFAVFVDMHPDYTLVIAGKPGLGYDAIQKTYKALRQDVQDKIIFAGYVSDERKYQLLAESTALVHIAHEEGFGIPVLEGFDFELPVIASDLPALREVGYDACVFVDKDDKDAIARGMQQVVTDAMLVRDLVQRGRERLRDFDWQRVAQSMIVW